MRNVLARNVLFFANDIICHADGHLIFAFICVKEGNVTAFLKPWPNGPASGRKLNLRRDLRWWPNGLKSFLTSTRKSQKK